MQIDSKASNIKHYLIALVVITALLLSAGYAIIAATKAFYNQQVAEETRRVARYYAQSLSTVADAASIIDGLLEDKLTTAGKVVARFDGEYSNQLLAEVAGIVQVDEIYVYNASGEIVCSNTGNYLGWRAEVGHPVCNFMQSDNESHIDEIRQDTESGTYLKYAYLRLDDTGRFLQVGVLADTVHDFLGKFEMQRLISEIVEDPYVKCVIFYDNNLQVMAGSAHDSQADYSLTDAAKVAILANMEFATESEHEGEHVYQVMLPIFVDGNKQGTLAISHATAETRALINRVSLIGIATLLVLFGLLLAMLYVTRKRNEILIRYSYYDAVTGLPNKTYLEDFIRGEVQHNGQKKSACLLIDCNFEPLNMAIGYQYSEMVLRECAATLLVAKPQEQHVFHIGAARFIIYVSSYEEQHELVALCQHVIESLRQPLQAKRTGVTIGVVEINNESIDANTLIKRASIAASRARDDEIDGYRFFGRSMEEQLQRETVIESELRAAVASNIQKNIYLHYQPIVDLKTSQVVGLEALARMQSPRLDRISPTEFIPIAEQTGLIIPLGWLILRSACDFLAQLEQKGYGEIKMSINISLVQLLRDDFVRELLRIVEEAGACAANLTLEITESLLLDEYETINEKLQELGKYGIQIAIDDFGTGYSSLSRTRELSVHGIKIDKSFIDYVLHSPPEKTITQDIIAMAHRQGYYVVAEGVEVQSQRDYLAQSNCDYMQGYLFSKPLAPAAVWELLREQG